MLIEPLVHFSQACFVLLFLHFSVRLSSMRAFVKRYLWQFHSRTMDTYGRFPVIRILYIIKHIPL